MTFERAGRVRGRTGRRWSSHAVHPGEGIVVGQLVLVRPAQLGGAIFDLGQPDRVGAIHIARRRIWPVRRLLPSGSKNIDGAATGQIGERR